MVWEHSYLWGRAYRDGRLVCSRVRVTVISDVRIGQSAPTPPRLRVRFLEGLDRTLRDELERLVLCRGLRRRRLAERIAPVEIVWSEPSYWLGHQSGVGRLEPTSERCVPLEEIEFSLRPVDP